MFGQTIIGKWITFDSQIGEEKSVVQIWKSQDGMFYGKITKIFDESKKDDICDKCDEKDSRYKQKVLRMTILMKMKKKGTNEWSGRTILDRSNGKVYKFKILRDSNNLSLTVLIGFSLISQTQTWVPVNN